jgi:phosphopantetheine--protein transferase-like protein
MTMGSIQGIGVDVVDVQRLKKVLDQQGAYFVGKVFTDGEIAYCQMKKNPHEHFAARFAAKEAVAVESLQGGRRSARGIANAFVDVAHGEHRCSVCGD